ncbi:hypothetical protein NLJ89_g7539 [Agrocybe chaxingu]|uniref:Uncharacterized protein n=1 Tax=Agrocybe chaxingu TaxID=84603 RepID=A0A9W8MRN2_9AGAR|nr:hypothetical protein NLJ89_g7539 [Agrocybe chaxingu]
MAAASLPLVEKSLLRGKWDAQISEATAPATDLAKLVVECRFRDALTSSQARTLFRPISRDLDLPFKDLLDLSTHPGSDSLEQELERLSLSIACLHAFVQANWTGPDLDIHPLELLTGDSDGTSSWTEESLHAKAITELAYGGEPAYHLVKDPAFLRLSQLLVGLTYNHIQSISWWRLRVAKVHQQILDEPVVTQEDFRALLEPLGSTLASEPDLAGRLHLELGLLEHHFSQDKLAKEDFIKAARSTGLEYELTGALGKRTKFQVTELSPARPCWPRVN